MSRVIFTLINLLLMSSYVLAQQNIEPNAGASCAGCGVCGGGLFIMIGIPIAILILNIALLIWVARDAKARGMDNAVMWMILVMFTSVVGFIIYIFSRPKGNLFKCRSCNNNRLEASAKCPQCGNI